MARITVEDCLVQENNRFALVQLASKRTKQLLQGAHPLISDHRDNKSVVVSLREIADGKVRFMTAEESAHIAQDSSDDESLPSVASTASVSRAYRHNGDSNGSESKSSAGDKADSGNDEGDVF